MKNHLSAVSQFLGGAFVVVVSAAFVHFAGLLTNWETSQPNYEMAQFRFSQTIDSASAIQIAELAANLTGIDYAYTHIPGKSLIFSYNPEIQNRDSIRKILDLQITKTHLKVKFETVE